MLFSTPTEIRLRCAMRADALEMIRLGTAAVRNELKYHKTMPEVITALESADYAPIELREKLLQISVGGDPESMLIGRFLPCLGKLEKPQRAVGCACGFAVDIKLQTSQKQLLRRKCSFIQR